MSKDLWKEAIIVFVATIAGSAVGIISSRETTERTIAGNIETTKLMIAANDKTLEKEQDALRRDNEVDDKREDDKFKSELIAKHYKNVIQLLTDEASIKKQDIIDTRVSKYILEQYLGTELFAKMVENALSMSVKSSSERTGGKKTGFQWPKNTDTFVDTVGTPIDGLRVEAITGMLYEIKDNGATVTYSEERLEDAIQKAADFKSIKEEITSTRAITTDNGLIIEYQTPESADWKPLSIFPLSDVQNIEQLRNNKTKLDLGIPLTGKMVGKQGQ